MNIFKNTAAEKYWHRLFEIGILVKGFNGLWEIASGLVILLISQQTINRIVVHMSRGELLEDPHDRLTAFFIHNAQHLSADTKLFVALYILAHGVLNIFLAVNLYRERLWAYLVTMGFMILFMIYQVYRITHTHSLILSIITVFDFIFVIITWHEYRYKKTLLKKQ